MLFLARNAGKCCELPTNGPCFRRTRFTRLAAVGGDVEEVAEAVADEVEGEDREEDAGAGREDEPGGLLQVELRVLQHRAPGGGGVLHAETEKAEGGFDQDG